MNSYTFDSSLDDLQIDTPSSWTGRIVRWTMLIAFALASMITTFSFFAVYAPGLGSVLHPDFAPFVAGTLGVVLFDLAGLGWTVLRARNSDSTAQFWIATAAAVATISLALLTSALYVLLSSSFDVGLYGAAGELTTFGQIMQIVGVVTMTAGFVLNFGAIAAYVNTGADVSKAVQDTQLRAFVTAGRHAADKARAELVTRRTLTEVMRQLPSLANAQGLVNGRGYLDQSFTAPRSLLDIGVDEVPNHRDADGDEAPDAARIQAEVQRLQAELATLVDIGEAGDAEPVAARPAGPTPSGNGRGGETDRPTPGRSD